MTTIRTDANADPRLADQTSTGREQAATTAAPPAGGVTLPVSSLDKLLASQSALDRLLAAPTVKLAQATGGGNAIQNYARDSIRNLIDTVTLDPHAQVAALRSDGDTTTIAATGQVKGGVGARGFAIGGVQLAYGVEVKVTQQGGPRAGGRPAQTPVSYVVTSEAKIAASGYVDAKSPKLGSVSGKGSAEGGGTYSETQRYSFDTKGDAERAARILQRINAANFAGVSVADPSLDKSRPVGDPTTPIGRAVNIHAVSADDLRFLQDNLVGKAGTTAGLGRIGVEGKKEGALPIAGLSQGSSAGSGRPAGETRSTRAFTAAQDGKPATITFTFTQELSGSDQSKVGLRAATPKLPGGTTITASPSVRSDAGKSVVTTVITHNLTPQQAAAYARVQGGNSIDDARILGGKLLQSPDAITWSNARTERVSAPVPSRDSLGDVTARYRTYTVSTTVKNPQAGDPGLQAKSLAAWSGNADYFRTHRDAQTVTKVTTTDFVRHGGEYQLEVAAESKGGGNLLPFEFKPNITKKATTDLQTASASETIGVTRTSAASSRPYNFGIAPKAYQDIENQLAGKAPSLITTTTPDGKQAQRVDSAYQRSSGTSIWDLARVSDGRNHGHPGVALANKVNDVLTRYGALSDGTSVNSTRLAEQLLGRVYSQAQPPQRAAIVATLRNDLGLDFGLSDLARANAAVPQRPDAAHFAEPFSRPQVQR